MGKDLRRQIAAGAAYLCCLFAALAAFPVAAGPNRWTAIGPDGANVVALAIDPRTATTVYAGTRGPGVLKSVDGGASWATANGPIQTPLNVAALAIDPSTPATVYAGTDRGVFKSIDAGQSWSSANSGLTGTIPITVTALAIDSGSPPTLYAGTADGLFKSMDGATHWTSIANGLTGLAPRVIAIDPATPSTVYVGVDAVDGINNGVFKTTDAGNSWARVYTTPSEMDVGSSVAAIAIDPVSPSRLYVGLDYLGVVTSVDGGANWAPAGTQLTAVSTSLSSLAIDPASSTLYAGTHSGAVFRSMDSGAHWTKVLDKGHSINVIAMPASARATVYSGSTAGLYQSVDDGQSWAYRNLGIRNVGVFRLAVDPSIPSVIYGSIESAVAKSIDGGVHWSETRVGDLDNWVTALLVDPSSPSVLYAGGAHHRSGPSLYKSTDGAMNWAWASTGLPWFGEIEAMALGRSRPSTLYAAQAFTGVLKSVDGGASWIPVNNGLTGVGWVGIYVSALAVDPTNADIAYVATPDAKIFKSTNGAAQWREVPIGVPPGTRITSLVIDPTTPSTIYASYVDYATDSGAVAKSSDGGETWIVPQHYQLPSGCCIMLAINPSAPSQIYAATQRGVFRTDNGTVSWSSVNSGLPNLEVNDIAIDQTGTLLRIAAAEGLFEYQVTPVTAVVIEYRNTEDFPGSPGGHFFYAYDPSEIVSVDNGSAGRFVRTGGGFLAGGTRQLCRFFGSLTPGPNAHFYTISDGECELLKSLQRTPAPLDVQQWNYEGLSFAESPVETGAGAHCPLGTIPVYRGYNNAYPASGPKNSWDSMHRYSTSHADIQQMVTQFGWIDEGIAFCSPEDQE